MLCHGPDHHDRVLKNALYLARCEEKRGKQVDYQILIPACFLHDITAFNPHRNDKDPEGHQEDILAAHRALNKIKMSKEISKRIIDVIRVHSSNTKKIKKDELIEATILRDADKMEIFGPLGIVRIFMARSRRGDSIDEIIRKFYTQKDLKRRYLMMKIPEARKLSKKNYQYSLDFFKKLTSQLKRKI